MDSDYFCYAEAKIAELQHQLAAAEARVKELEEAYLDGCFGLFDKAQAVAADNARLREGLEKIYDMTEGKPFRYSTVAIIARTALDTGGSSD